MRSTSRKKASSNRNTTVSIPRVVVASLKGGSGKTTLSLGLIGALRNRRLAVRPFKKGPDYIDAAWLAAAANSPCYNLDPYLVGFDRICDAFASRMTGADVAVIEGNRGLFDGMDSSGTYSTASVARAIQSPVLLIVDCTKSTRTIAALLLGVERFEKGLALGGIVLNQVAGARHERVIAASIRRHLRTPVLGAIPRLGDARMPERHMGLTPMFEHKDVEEAISWATGTVEKYVNVDAVMEAASKAKRIALPKESAIASRASEDGPQIGVIKDSAFQFYYPENFEALTARGAHLVEVSALGSSSLPDVDAVYIGGGFPETHAIALSENRPFRASLKKAANAGLPIYAECGGLIYLGKSIRTGGKTYPMAGVLPISFSLKERPQAHGYTALRVTGANPFFKRGTELRGHEFRYSAITSLKDEEGVKKVFRMERGIGIDGGRGGLCRNNVLATYTHLHALGSPEWADGLVAAARKFRNYKRRK